MKEVAPFIVTFVTSFAGSYGFAISAGSQAPWAIALGVSCSSLTCHRMAVIFVAFLRGNA